MPVSDPQPSSARILWRTNVRPSSDGAASSSKRCFTLPESDLALCNAVLTFEKHLSVTVQMKAAKQYFHVVLFVLQYRILQKEF